MKTEQLDMRIIGTLNGAHLLQEDNDNVDGDGTRSGKGNDIFEDEFTMAIACKEICERIGCDKICEEISILCDGKITLCEKHL